LKFKNIMNPTKSTITLPDWFVFLRLINHLNLIHMRKVALGIFAHPDDAEFLCTGTLSLLLKAGWSIHIATMAPGDKES